MMTIEKRLAEETLGAYVSELEKRWQHAETLRHEDGSVTVIEQEEYIEDWMSPRRDTDCNVARLVMKHRDYVDLDDPDYGIEEARDRWGEESPLVERYVRMFRPDIAYYLPRWTVQGYSQGDWAYGYAYVLWEDFVEGKTSGNESEVAAARLAIEAEVKEYEDYFAGRVFWGRHLTVGEPIVAYGDHGAYVAGYEIEEDNCGGFLGYESMKDIAWHFTGSPVIEQ